MNAPLNHPLPAKFRPACHQVHAALAALGETVLAEIYQHTGLKPTTARNAVQTLRNAGWILHTRRDRKELLRLNPTPPIPKASNSPLMKLASKRGWIRSTEAAEQLGISKAKVERQMEALADAGEAITCTIVRPGLPDEIELRPAGFLPNAGPFRIVTD